MRKIDLLDFFKRLDLLFCKCFYVSDSLAKKVEFGLLLFDNRFTGCREI